MGNIEGQIKFSEYTKIWFNDEVAKGIRPSVTLKKQTLLDKFVIPYFADKNLDQFVKKDIEGFLDQQYRRYSKTTVIYIQILLKSIFQAAVKNGYLDKNPMEGMSEMKKDSSQFVPWSHEEIARLLEVASLEGEGMIYKFVLLTGVRMGELLALSWSDIDFDNQTVTISKNVIPGENGIEVMRSGSRTVTLTTNLISELHAYREQQELMKGNLADEAKLNLIFPKKDGGIQNPSSVRARFNHIIEKAGVRRITFHGLRKMNATLLLEAGVSLDVIKQSLVHANLKTNVKKFYIPISKADKNAIRALDYWLKY